MSLPLAIQDMHYVDLCSGLQHPAKMEEKLTQHYIATYCILPKDTSYCVSKLLSVPAGLLVVFARFLQVGSSLVVDQNSTMLLLYCLKRFVFVGSYNEREEEEILH